jgi:hypothetical protein
MSSLIARTSLRKFSACFSWSDWSSIRLSLVTPSTRRATSLPNLASMSSIVASVSSTVSCRSAVTIEAVSSFMPVRMPATSSGWAK